MLDLDAYLARIGLRGRPGVGAIAGGRRIVGVSGRHRGGSLEPAPGLVAELHRAPVTSIPFENRDPRRGTPVSLEPEDLQRKLVMQRRGGYCFEQNLLLKGAFEALGRVQVQTLLWRVRVGAAPGNPRPGSHLVLRVQTDGGDWQGLSLSEETPAGASVRAVDPGEVDELIASRFGLQGFDG